jgi:hypothetical protein
MKRLWGREPGKRFAIPADRIRDVAPGYGACFATDEITVAGKPVGYMVRDPVDRHPDEPSLSGWTFMSGDETQAYVDDAANIEVYDVNTIANYDPDIVPFLDAPAGSSFARARDPRTGVLGPLEPER